MQGLGPPSTPDISWVLDLDCDRGWTSRKGPRRRSSYRTDTRLMFDKKQMYPSTCAQLPGDPHDGNRGLLITRHKKYKPGQISKRHQPRSGKSVYSTLSGNRRGCRPIGTTYSARRPAGFPETRQGCGHVA